jgi:hypothetical protein
MEHAPSWIHASLIYLGAAVLAVPLARLLGLGSIIGYLAAGIAIGPWGLKLVTDPQAMLHFAEFGVVLMLFLVGLELEPRRLWQLRRPIFGWGSLQMAGSTLLMLGAGMAAGLDWRLALVAGLGLSLSSTAIGLSVLNERNLMATSAGQSVLSVALLQDIAAIPILAVVPLLALQGAAAAGAGHGWLEAAKAFGVIGAIVFGGRLLLRPALALDRTQRHARDLHRRVAAAGGGHRGADAERGPVDGAGRLPGRRAAGRERVPARAGNRHRTLQGPAAGPVLHRGGHEHRLRRGAAEPGPGGTRRARLPAAEGTGAVGHGTRDAAAGGRTTGVRDPAGPGRRVRLRGLPECARRRRDRCAHLVAAGGRGGGVDAADTAAAGGRRPLDRTPGPAAAAAAGTCPN